jgi:hypothetical protein
MDLVLDTIVGHDMYYFMDGDSGYNKSRWKKKIRKKLHSYQNGEHMLLMLCHLASNNFSKVVNKTFNKYLNEFMQVFLDDLSVFGKKENHLEQLQKCLQEGCINGISHNPNKCVLCQF